MIKASQIDVYRGRLLMQKKGDLFGLFDQPI
jgi:hypothetical protein